MKQSVKKIIAREVLILLGLGLIIGLTFIVCQSIQSANEKRIEQVKSEIDSLKNEFKITFSKTIQKDDDYIKELYNRIFSKQQKANLTLEDFSKVLSTDPEWNLKIYDLNKFHDSSKTDYTTFCAKTGLTKNDSNRITSSYQRLYIYLLRDGLYSNTYSNFLNHIRDEKFQRKMYDSVYKLRYFRQSFETFQAKLLRKGDDLKPKSEIVQELENIQININSKHHDLSNSIDSYFNIKKYDIVKFLVLLFSVIFFPLRYLMYLLFWSIKALKSQ